ncbi:DNA cytosine methyltransferase, partial [Verrucomicrobiales bacterium]|nr:DNA cytosine methyltransferase [Verrucomicrobiales bacterium]
IKRFENPGKKIHNHTALEVTDKVKEFISHVPKDGGSRTSVPKSMWLKCHSEGYNGHKDVYGRAYWDQPTNTLTTGCNSISKGRYVHPEKNRAFTFREASAVQGFSDNFIFIEQMKGGAPVPRSELSIQIGNAVPPPLAWSFAKVFSKEIQRVGIPKL